MPIPLPRPLACVRWHKSGVTLWLAGPRGLDDGHEARFERIMWSDEPHRALALPRDILAAFGLAIGVDRPDFVVVDREAGSVVSIIEVKYIAGDTASGRFREAVGQIVRYARGYAPVGQTGEIVAQSLVALSREAPTQIDASAAAPGSVDFDGIRRSELDAWAQRFAAPAP